MTESRSLEYTTLDVFTSTRYAGNPLAVVRLPQDVDLSSEQKLAIAKEFNYSETVFLHARQSGTQIPIWRLDIFCPLGELPLAGHPVVGAACLAMKEVVDADETSSDQKGVFLTKAGPIGLGYDVGSQVANALLPHHVHIHSESCSVAEITKLQPSLEGIASLRPASVVSIVKGMTFVLVELASVEELNRVSGTMHYPISFQRDSDWDSGLMGMYFFTRVEVSEGRYKLRTRMIESSIGEDPATGSAACALSSYLALVEGSSHGTIEFDITQGVEMGRRSDIGVTVVLGENEGTSASIKEVRLKGQAVTVMQGRLMI